MYHSLFFQFWSFRYYDHNCFECSLSEVCIDIGSQNILHKFGIYDKEYAHF